MSEKRFFTTLANEEYTLIQKKGNPRSTYLKYSEVVDLLNEQQATIEQLQDLCGESDSENAKLRIENKKLKAQLREKEEDEKLYANEILELRETNKEHIKFKSLGGNY